MSITSTKLALAFIGAFALTSTAAMAQTTETGGPNTGTSTLAGPAQKVGSSNQKAGGKMKMKKMSKKKKHM